MKKLLLCVAAVAMTMGVFAQEKSYFGARAGMNINNIRMSYDGDSESMDSRIGYHVGGVYNISLMKSTPLYLETGLYFTNRGAEFEGAKINANYLQLPVMISYHFNISKKFTIEPAVGGYYAFGVGGKIKDGDDEVKIFKDYDGYSVAKRSDFGLRFAVGTTFNKHYYLGVGYDLGLMDVNKDFVDDVKLKNGSFFISLGYNF